MSWAGNDAPRSPFLGEAWTEAQRRDLTSAFTGPVFLAHPQSPHRWAIRVNQDGNLEFLATQGDRQYDVIVTLARTGSGFTVGPLVNPGR